jgi:hypothetical protein
VTISPVQTTDTTVTFFSGSPAIAVPSTVIVPAYQTSAPVTVTAVAPGSAQITASLNATSVISTMMVVY